MKRLLIVGASVLQLPAILKAKKMGLYVGVADYNPQAVGVPYADKFYNASTMDEDAILCAAQEFKPDGIMTLATDMPMRGVAKASERLGLHSISYSTAIKATDKYEMIKAFKEHNVASPWYFVVDSMEELRALEYKLQYPCVMKPTDNSGSHGVLLVRDFDHLMKSYGYCHASARKGRVIIEEFLRGNEVSVEVVVVDGTIHVLQITDKITTGPPFFVEMGHSQPSLHKSEIQEAIKQLARKACKAVGIDQGSAHVEMMVTKNGPVMIELGARLGGDYITTSLVPFSTGIDIVKATIDMALGKKPDTTPHLNCGAAIRYIEAPEGIICSIKGVNEAKSLSGVRDVIMTKTVGDLSVPIHCSNDRIGSVIAQAETVDKAVEVCNAALNKIIVSVE